MNKREELGEMDPELLFMDPESFNIAIVGLAERAGQEQVVCYDKSKVIGVLMNDGMSAEEAYEYFYFNIVGAYIGEKTPIFLETL
jgi:hypothetical protein